MEDSDEKLQHPCKQFRNDYGQSADEEQQPHPPNEVEVVNQHRFPQQQLYLLESNTPCRLRFPENRTDESYLVLEAEEPVKSKPRGAAAMHHPSDTSGTETTDHSSSDAGVATGYRPKPRQRASKKRSRTPDDDTRDDDTTSEGSEMIESREGELAMIITYYFVTIIEYQPDSLKERRVPMHDHLRSTICMIDTQWPCESVGVHV